jgi:hypothetical protein
MAKEQHEHKGDDEPIQIPAIEYAPQVYTGVEQRSQTVSMDQLGPIVVNTDGTMQRITNWDKMTEAEQANVMRVLSKRNAQRLAALQQKQDSDNKA